VSKNGLAKNWREVHPHTLVIYYQSIKYNKRIHA